MIPRMQIAQLAQRAENGYVGVNCGLMDQFASACGVAGSALLLDCRSLDWRPVPLPDGRRARRVPQRIGAAAGWLGVQRSPRAVRGGRRCPGDDRSDGALAPRCHAGAARRGGRPSRSGGPAPLPPRRQRNRPGRGTIAALEAGDLAAVGALFAAGHASCRDLFDVSSAELDALVEVASSVPGVVAARMTGAGFGGCTVNLVRPDAVDALRAAVETEYAPRRA